MGVTYFDLPQDKSGSFHRTVIGGTLTVLKHIFITFFVGLLFKKLVNYEEDQLSNFQTVANFTETPRVNYTDLNF